MRGTLSRERLLLCGALVASQLVAIPDPIDAQATLPRIFVWQETVKGTETEEIRWPVAVAARSSEEFAVADARDPRLLIFSKVGVSWQLSRVTPLPATPVDLVWDGRRYVAALRGESSLAALEGPDLRIRRIALPSGGVPGRIAASDDGGLLVFDASRQVVQRFDSETKPVGETIIGLPVDALVEVGGGFLAASSAAAEIRRYSSDGRLLADWSLHGAEPVPAWPVAMALDPSGDLTVVDRHGNRLVVLDSTGRPIGGGARMGWEPGLLRFPSDLAILPDGRVLVADQGNGRVQIFRRTDRSGAP